MDDKKLYKPSYVFYFTGTVTGTVLVPTIIINIPASGTGLAGYSLLSFINNELIIAPSTGFNQITIDTHEALRSNISKKDTEREGIAADIAAAQICKTVGAAVPNFVAAKIGASGVFSPGNFILREFDVAYTLAASDVFVTSPTTLPAAGAEFSVCALGWSEA